MFDSAVFKVPVRYLVTLALCLLLGAIAAVGFAASRPVTFSAHTVLYVTPASARSNDNLSQVLSYVFDSMASYEALASTSQVLEGAATELGGGVQPDELLAGLAVEVPTGSSMITITSTKENRGEAVDIANAVGGALKTSVVELSPRQKGKPTIDVAVVQPAEDDVRSNGRHIMSWALGGVVIGLAVGIVLARLLFGPAPLSTLDRDPSLSNEN